MSDFIDDQIIFSNLIKEVGSTCIYNGKTISDILTIEGVSLWEVSSPEMAWRHLVNIAEAKNIRFARKSIVAKKNIAKGEKFNVNNITTKRAGVIKSAMQWKKIIGKKSIKKYKKDDLI